MYEFATGVIDVWEKGLLNSLDQERMLKAPDRASAFMVLFDTNLGEIIAGNLQKNIEDIFSEDLMALKKKLAYALGDDKELLISFLFLRFNAFNLKSVLKKKFFKEQAKDFKLFEFASNLANVYVKELVCEADKILNASKESYQEISSKTIEIAVDKAYFKVKLSMAKKEKALMLITRLEIDIANLRSFLAKNSQMFLPGGNLTVSQIEKLAHGKEEESSKNLKRFLETLELAFLLESNQENTGDILIERKLEAYFAQRIFRREKEKGSGIEKVLAFFQKKINSHANIRLILFAKENGLSVEEIEKALLPIN
ncbi:MAG: V-type ATPase subunit [bacterium]